MNRYNVITQKNPREIVLLKALPCHWGRCTFCDYIEDNDTNAAQIIAFNRQVLTAVTGEYGQLEVIDSASVFELPVETLQDIQQVVLNNAIHTLYFEAHYHYRKRLQEIRALFPKQKVVFKTGVETFDNEFREEYLHKGANFTHYTEVATYFDSICLLVGIKGQTKEMIARDIDIAIQHFPRVCVNIYMANTTPIVPDTELIHWFEEEYAYLDALDYVEVLWHNTDFGVGD